MGLAVGLRVDDPVGSNVGAHVGGFLLEAANVGWSVCRLVGIEVGLLVGSEPVTRVGAFVGLLVGSSLHTHSAFLLVLVREAWHHP